MHIQSERKYDGGVLVVTDVPAQTCNCKDNDQILLGDGAFIAGYAKYLAKLRVIGDVQVSLHDLKQTFTLQDFIPQQ
ncbi:MULTISPECIES: hypothetical protein [unclassified Paenibacillus]|uniref:hypothetical protein n=1 Tax=unclassified Paenibacillus TaxID=185978 RepID=UPI0030192593